MTNSALRQRYERYAALIRWLGLRLWQTARVKMLFIIGMEASSKIIHMGGFMLMLNTLLWIIVDGSRPQAIRRMFPDDGSVSIAVLGIVLAVPLVFLGAALLRLVATMHSQRIAEGVSCALLTQYLRNRLPGLLKADTAAQDSLRRIMSMASREEDRLFNASFSASLALMRFLSSLTVASAALLASILLDPATMLLFLPFIAGFGGVYVVLSYGRTRDDTVKERGLQQHIRDHREEVTKSIEERARTGDTEVFLSDYMSIYRSSVRDLAAVKQNAGVRDQFWRELFTALGSGFLLLIVYLRGGEGELSLSVLTVFFFLFRFFLANIVTTFRNLNALNRYYQPLRQIHAGIARLPEESADFT